MVQGMGSRVVDLRRRLRSPARRRRVWPRGRCKAMLRTRCRWRRCWRHALLDAAPRGRKRRRPRPTSAATSAPRAGLVPRESPSNVSSLGRDAALIEAAVRALGLIY